MTESLRRKVFVFGGVLPSVSASAGEMHVQLDYGLVIDLASPKPSTSFPLMKSFVQLA